MSSAEFPTPEGLSNRQLDIMTACANAVAKSEDSLRFQIKLREKAKHIQNFKFLFEGHPYCDHYNKLVRSYQQYLKDYFESAARQQQHAAQQQQQEMQLRKQAAAAQKRIHDLTNNQQQTHQTELQFGNNDYNMGKIEMGHDPTYHSWGPAEGCSSTHKNHLMDQYQAAYGSDRATGQYIPRQDTHIRKPDYYDAYNNSNDGHLSNTRGRQHIPGTHPGPIFNSFLGSQPQGSSGALTSTVKGALDTGLLPTPCSDTNGPVTGVAPITIHDAAPTVGFKRLRRSRTPSDSGED